MQPIMWLIIGLLVPAAALTPPNGPNDRRRARLEQRGLSPQPPMQMVAAPPVRAGVRHSRGSLPTHGSTLSTRGDDGDHTGRGTREQPSKAHATHDAKRMLGGMGGRVRHEDRQAEALR